MASSTPRPRAIAEDRFGGYCLVSETYAETYERARSSSGIRPNVDLDTDRGAVRCPAPRRRWAGRSTCCCSWPAGPGRSRVRRSSATEDSAIVDLSPARRADRARLRRALPRSAHLRPRHGGVRGRLGLSAARTAGDAGPPGAQAAGRARRRDGPSRAPSRRRDAVPAQGTARDVADPGHAGHRRRRAPARAPDRQRPIDPRAPARGSGAGVVPVGARRSSTAPGRARRCRSCGASWPPNGSRGGRRRSGWSPRACSRWRRARSTTPGVRVRRSASRGARIMRRTPKPDLVRAVRAGAQQLTWALSGHAPDGWFARSHRLSEIRDTIACRCAPRRAGLVLTSRA